MSLNLIRDRVRRRSASAFAILGLLAGCGGASASDRSAGAVTDKSADALGVRIGNSDRVAHYALMTTENVIQAALDEGVELMVAETVPPEKSNSIYEWTRLVVRLHGTDHGAFGAKTAVQECWEYIFEGRVLIGDERSVECRSTAPLTIESSPRPRIPEGALERMADVLTEFSPVGGDSGTHVREALEHEFDDLAGASIDVAAVDGELGVTITDGINCAMARRTSNGAVETWMAQSDDAVTDAATCPAASAANGYFMDPSS